MAEANRFWFYSLVFAIIWSCVQLLHRPLITSSDEKLDKTETQLPAEKRLSEVNERQALKRRLLTDCFDLFIPGYAIGWIRTTSAFVGFATLISTTLSSKDVWDKVQ
jgi:hypothetical protein